MCLNKLIQEKHNNIGSLSIYIKNRYFLLEKLKSNFKNFKNKDLTIPQMCWYIFNNIQDEQNCICGKHKKWKTFKEGWRETCGNKKCFVEKRKLTNIKKYGVDNPQKSQEIKEKTKETNIKKYGVDNPQKSQEIRKKVSETKINYTQEKKEKIYKKVKETWCKKSEFEINKIKEKKRKTWSEKSEEEKNSIKNKRKKTMLNNYGVEYTFNSSVIQDKIKQTMLKKYGTTVPYKSDIIRKKISKTYSDNKTKELIKSLKKWNCEYIKHEYSDNNSLTYYLFCNRKKKEFKISYTTLRVRMLANIEISPFFNKFKGSSKKENVLLNFIKREYDGEVLHRHKIKNNLEIDIYLPGLNLGFEFNGLWWHNELYKDNEYHIKKTNSCKNHDIKLIHIWEDDWDFKQKIIKSRIKSLLNKNKKIYARKCEIKNVSTKQAKLFFNENHLQGFIGASHYIGLFNENILVCCMSFGKLRKILNTTNEKDVFELYRFCNLQDTNVIGGASKLFSHFIKTYNPIKVISYFDRCWGASKVYKKIGFSFDKNTSINYYYIIDKIIRKHRFNYRKDKLVKEGFDPNKTEHEIMLQRGYYRIYDCGNEKWIWYKK